ncbi:MAG TPA: DUF2959 family protein [Bryobacteraceae bacterium]|nr:DUF2959 family protein [Bryobacteraceae bacterium]
MARYCFAAFLVLSILPGCSRLYYASMEKIGKEKRDILVKRITQGKQDQEEARQQIQTTLEAFKELTGFEGGELERVHDKLNREYERSRDRANDLANQTKSIDRVARDMFAEWDKEIGSMRNSSLKQKSRSLLRDARARHEQYMAAMRSTQRKMEPVLQAFYDQVTFLKHNLNARAIQSLKKTVAAMDTQVEALVADIERSIKESDAFIKTLTEPDHTS